MDLVKGYVFEVWRRIPGIVIRYICRTIGSPSDIENRNKKNND